MREVTAGEKLGTEDQFPPKSDPPPAPLLAAILLKEGPKRLVLVSITMIAKYPLGRVVFHLICIVRHPAHFTWHMRGIGREIGVRAQTATL